MAKPHPPTLVVECVSNDSNRKLLSARFIAVPDHVDVYELTETVITFPPDTQLTVKAIFHANIREIVLSVSSGDRLVISVIATVRGIFEACSSIVNDSDLRITLKEDADEV